ncbi:hypothetical protein, partial [Erwinia amylovora]|uniref:hypothetical protein n=1 Tax=Erwinia amylovora TaxID=552 RepID=UPI001965C4F7
KKIMRILNFGTNFIQRGRLNKKSWRIKGKVTDGLTEKISRKSDSSHSWLHFADICCDSAVAV